MCIKNKMKQKQQYICLGKIALDIFRLLRHNFQYDGAKCKELPSVLKKCISIFNSFLK